jgi:putative tricarboxylic transport membrane protein
LVLGVVLGFMVESNYRRSLVLSGGEHAIFWQEPIALTLLLLAAAIVGLSLWREWRRARPS